MRTFRSIRGQAFRAQAIDEGIFAIFGYANGQWVRACDRYSGKLVEVETHIQANLNWLHT